MQTENQEENKVVSIFDRNREDSKDKSPEKKAEAAEDYDFETIVRQNMEKRNKMQQERLKSNRGVIRSYRLKN